MKKNKKRNYILIIIVIFCITILVPSSYAIYHKTVDIGVTTTTGELICDVTVDTNSDYIENNEVFFYINVNNFVMDGSTTILTSTDIIYDLIIENKDGSEAKYRYLGEDGSTNETAEATATISNKTMGKEKTTQRYKVYVTTDAETKMQVDFNIKLDARQKVME